jgi:hypothetical protein
MKARDTLDGVRKIFQNSWKYDWCYCPNQMTSNWRVHSFWSKPRNVPKHGKDAQEEEKNGGKGLDSKTSQFLKIMISIQSWRMWDFKKQTSWF